MEKVSLGPFTRVSAKCHTEWMMTWHGWQGKTHFQARKTSGQWILHVNTRHFLRALTYEKSFSRSLHEFALNITSAFHHCHLQEMVQSLTLCRKSWQQTYRPLVSAGKQAHTDQARLTGKCTAKAGKTYQQQTRNIYQHQYTSPEDTYHTPRKFKFKII